MSSIGTKAYCLFFFEIHRAISRSSHDTFSKWKALVAIVVLEAHIISLTALWTLTVAAPGAMPTSKSLLIPFSAVAITALNYWIFFRPTDTVRAWEINFRRVAARQGRRRSAMITGFVVVGALIYIVVSYFLLPSAASHF